MIIRYLQTRCFRVVGLCFVCGFGWLGVIAAHAQVRTYERLRAKAEKRYETEKYDEALHLYQQAFKSVQTTDWIRAANVCVDISTVHYATGHLNEGKKQCVQGLTIARQLKAAPDSLYFKLYASLGVMYTDLFSHDSAHFFFQQANKIYEKNPQLIKDIPDYVTASFNNQAMLHLAENDFQEVAVYMQKAIHSQENNAEYQAILLNNLAGYEEKMGRFKVALALRKRAVSLLHRQHKLVPASVSLGLAWNFFNTNDIDQSIAILSRIPPDSKTRLLVIVRLQQCHVGKSEFRKAMNWYHTGRQWANQQKILKGEQLAELELGQALLLEKLGENDQALKHCQQALQAAHLSFSTIHSSENPSFAGSISEKVILKTILVKARIFRQLHQQTSDEKYLSYALRAYTSAIEFKEKMVIRLDRLETKFLSLSQEPIFEEALETAWQMAEHTQNFYFKSIFFSILEHSQATALAAALQDKKLKPTTLPDSLLIREKQIQQEIAQIKTRIKNPTEVTRAMQQRLTDLEYELSSLLDEYRFAYPNYYQIRYQQAKISLPQLQDKLKSDETYLGYFYGQKHVYAIAVTNQQVRIKKLTNQLLHSQIRRLNQQVSTDPTVNRYEGSPLSQQLYTQLVHPFAALIHSKLFIARSGQLMRLPFEVLEPTGEEYLGQTSAISYIHSATVRFTQAVDQTNRQWLTYLPFTSTVGPWKALPETRLLKNQSWGTLMADTMATKKAFLNQHEQYGIIHLATHAHSKDTLIQEPYLAFYPTAIPYKMFLHEIVHLNLSRTRLLILGTCEGGIGEEIQGEGIQNLTYGFSYAGCPSVVSSVWKAHDRTTAYLTDRFIQYCQRGYDLSEALRLARVDYFKSDLGKKYNHPFYWANLTLWGNNTPLHTSRITIYVYTIGLVLILLSGLLVWRLKR